MAEKYSHINFKPTESVAKAARAALHLREEQPPSRRGGTAVGVARARQLANRQNVAPKTVKRMKAFFDRHEVDKKAEGFKRGEKGFPSRGKIAWELWGGDAGYGWAKKIVRQMEAADAKAIAVKKVYNKLRKKAMASVRIYDSIGTGEGELSAKAFSLALEDLGDVKAITVYVNSKGGSVIEGIAIAGMLERHPAKVTAMIEGGALSIASYIVMKADKVVMANDAWLMIHNPATVMQGDSGALRKTASMMDRMKDQLVEAYESKTGMDKSAIESMMDEETWFTADEAIAYGFVDEKEEPDNEKELKQLDVRAFRNVPEVVASAGFIVRRNQSQRTKSMAATITQIKASCKGCTSDFIVEQLEAGASVQDAVAAFSDAVNKNNAELKEEVESLKATIAAMEEQYAELEEKMNGMEKPEAEEDEDKPKAEEEKKPMAEEEKPMAEEEEKKPEAVARASHQRPVARPAGVQTTARQQWKDAVASAMQLPHVRSKADAVRYANRNNEGLRVRMLQEVQSR